MQLTLHIVARTLFDSEVTADVLAVRDEVNTIMGLYNFLVAFPMLEKVLHLPIPGIIKFRRSRAKLDAVVASLIAKRRTLSRAELEQRGDLLSMLMASRERRRHRERNDRTQVRDELLTIFLAGYETVANALTWTWYLLSQNPEAADKMYAEVKEVLGTGPNARTATVDDYPRFRYTEQVFAESMRLYPPAWAMGRQSTVPIELGPYRFPPDTHFFFSQYVMHR